MYACAAVQLCVCSCKANAGSRVSLYVEKPEDLDFISGDCPAHCMEQLPSMSPLSASNMQVCWLLVLHTASPAATAPLNTQSMEMASGTRCRQLTEFQIVH